jgi:hypothetical protein
VLEHGELITALDLPELPFARHSRYRKVRDRASYAFALVSLAAALELCTQRVQARDRGRKERQAARMRRSWKFRKGKHLLWTSPSWRGNCSSCSSAMASQGRGLTGTGAGKTAVCQEKGQEKQASMSKQQQQTVSLIAPTRRFWSRIS